MKDKIIKDFEMNVYKYTTVDSYKIVVDGINKHIDMMVRLIIDSDCDGGRYILLTSNSKTNVLNKVTNKKIEKRYKDLVDNMLVLAKLMQDSVHIKNDLDIYQFNSSNTANLKLGLHEHSHFSMLNYLDTQTKMYNIEVPKLNKLALDWIK